MVCCLEGVTQYGKQDRAFVIGQNLSVECEDCKFAYSVNCVRRSSELEG